MSRTVEINIPRIRTGYYGNIKNYINANYTLLSISRTTPNIKDANIKELPILAPSQQLLDDYKNGRISWIDYDTQYREQIAKLGKLQDLITVFACLVTCEYTRGIVLLCYEKDYMHCHRTILADIINQSGLVDEAVEEFNKND